GFAREISRHAGRGHRPASDRAAGQQHAVPERGHVRRPAAGLHQAGGAEGGSSVRDRQPPLPHHQPDPLHPVRPLPKRAESGGDDAAGGSPEDRGQVVDQAVRDPERRVPAVREAAGPLPDPPDRVLPPAQRYLGPDQPRLYRQGPGG
ncbi:unnamed protein product, partial [Ectocarpus fasciculatus]